MTLSGASAIRLAPAKEPMLRRFIIPLDDESRYGPEAAHLQLPDFSGRVSGNGLWIWRP
jgi:hypothetical protein